MDRIARYRQLVKQAIQNIAAELPEDPNIRVEMILDDQQDHYELMEIGWDGPRRVHGSLVHCDIIEGKVHVEHDGTDIGVADFLLSNGVPCEDIVLGFHPPELRKLTPFAVA
ncbi:MAG TPA: XisI protein [Chthonomonadaceae bacterium]|nr:XisI protein [Chthonomonadaceae bacterium]